MIRPSDPRRGATLIEALIAVGVLAIIGLGTSALYKNVSFMLTQRTGRANADQAIKLVQSLLEKDITGATAITSSGATNLTITRFVAAGAETIKYATSCVPAPPGPLQGLGFPTLGSCAFSCSNGSLPVLTVTRSRGATQQFPPQPRSVKQSDALGVVACFTNVPGAYSVHADVFGLFLGNDGHQAGAIRSSFAVLRVPSTATNVEFIQ
jgi:Tfp pilus assembly protein PilE